MGVRRGNIYSNKGCDHLPDSMMYCLAHQLTLVCSCIGEQQPVLIACSKVLMLSHLLASVWTRADPNTAAPL